MSAAVSHSGFYFTKNARSYLSSHFLMFPLCRCCLIHSMDPSNKPEVEQKGENTSVQKQPMHKRVPKRCSKCGKSVVNLSRNQKDVHGMKKLKRNEWHVKNQREKNKRAKNQRRRRKQESSSDEESQDTDEKRVTLEERKRIKEGTRMMKREEKRAKHKKRRKQQESTSDEESQDTDQKRVTLEESKRIKKEEE